MIRVIFKAFLLITFTLVTGLSPFSPSSHAQQSTVVLTGEWVGNIDSPGKSELARFSLTENAGAIRFPLANFKNLMALPPDNPTEYVRLKRFPPGLFEMMVDWTTSKLRQHETSAPQATNVRIAMREGDIYGDLFVTIAGTEKKVTQQAQQAWIINGGLQVVYSSDKGAGGYEGEGQSLHLYDVATGKHKRIMSEYFIVETVKEVITSNKKRALLVMMEDSGLGASYLAVVDPLRGEVFFRRWVRILANKGDTIVLGFFKEGDWAELESGKKVQPYKSETHNLNSLLRGRVMVNKKETP